MTTRNESRAHVSRRELRGKYERTDLHRIRLRIHHARNRAEILSQETTANDTLLAELLQQEKELIRHGEG